MNQLNLHQLNPLVMSTKSANSPQCSRSRRVLDRPMGPLLQIQLQLWSQIADRALESR